MVERTSGLTTKHGLLFSETARIGKRHRYSVLPSALVRERRINYREAYVYAGQNVALQLGAATSASLGASVDQILADQTTLGRGALLY